MTPSTTQIYSDKIIAISKEVTDVFVINHEGKILEKMFKSLDPSKDLSQLIIWLNKYNAAVRTEFPKVRFSVFHFAEKKLILLVRENVSIGVVINKSASESVILGQILQTLGWALSEKPGNDTETVKKKTPFIMDLGGASRSPFAAKQKTVPPALEPQPPAVPQPAAVASKYPQTAPQSKSVPTTVTTAEKSASVVVEPTPAAEKKKGQPMIVVGIIAAVVVIGVSIFFLTQKKPSPAESTVASSEESAAASGAEPSSAAASQDLSEKWKEAATSARAQLAAVTTLASSVHFDLSSNAKAVELANAAESMYKKEKYEQAANSFQQAVKAYGQPLVEIAKNDFQTALATVNVPNAKTYRSANLNTMEAAAAAAEEKVAAGDYAEAYKQYITATEAASNWRKDVLGQILTLARTAAANKETESAKSLYLDLLLLDPGNRDAVSFLYRNYYRTGQVITNSIGMKLAYITPGEFLMGSPMTEAGRDSDETVFTAVLTRGYFIGVTEVTQGQWAEIMGDPTAKVTADAKQASGFVGPSIPMHGITYDEVLEFCQKLSQKEGKKYRLPTEAEWEYACRAGTTTAYANGKDTLSPNEANIYDPSLARESPIAAGSLKFRNTWGLADMHGNVWEWCSDWYSYYPSGVVENPSGPTNQQVGRLDLAMRVLRGGSWNDDASNARSANRWQYSPAVTTNYIGFRVVMEVNEFPRTQP